MATLKEVQLKITGIKKTKKITSAMKMVATSRLRGAQRNMDAFRPYADKFDEVLGSLAQKAGDSAVSSLLTPKEDVKKVHIVLMTSDRGLCGGFNVNLLDRVEAYLKENSDQDLEVSFTNFGKRGRDWCRKNDFPIVDEYLGIVGSAFGFNVASISGQKIINGFLEDRYDEVYVVYSEFVSMGKQKAGMKKILPIPPIETAEEDEDAPFMAEHICEPSPGELLGEMLPKNVFIQIFSALLETSTGEHAARMTAMDNATKACGDMIEELRMIFNKARQAAITADLMDIVGGAEALNG